MECKCPCHRKEGLCGIDACCAESGKIFGKKILVIGDDAEQILNAMKKTA